MNETFPFYHFFSMTHEEVSFVESCAAFPRKALSDRHSLHHLSCCCCFLPLRGFRLHDASSITEHFSLVLRPSLMRVMKENVCSSGLSGEREKGEDACRIKWVGRAGAKISARLECPHVAHQSKHIAVIWQTGNRYQKYPLNRDPPDPRNRYLLVLTYYFHDACHLREMKVSADPIPTSGIAGYHIVPE